MSQEKNVNREFRRSVQARRCRIPEAERTLTALTKLNGRVYVYCGDPETQRQFIEDAENEQFRYGDGVSLRERRPDAVMALNKDRTVNFIGFAGRMAFQYADHFGSGKDAVPLIKVDYRKYLAGCQDFLCRP
ncbi:MAG: hypothetical protein LUE61_11565 [Clostridiales bacterium]|nr:hypothetical protein [Clostridiales bacterium]